jgi:hypothetical protein
MQQWEYKIVKVDAGDGALSAYRQATYQEVREDSHRWDYPGVNRSILTINDLGAQGWELVHIDSLIGTGAPHKREAMAVFKRPKQEQDGAS